MLLIATGVVLTLFAGRLIDLQAVKGEALATAALDQRLRTQTLPATRGAILDAAVALREAGAILGPVICVIDRESGGTEKLAAQGLELHPLFRMHELTP